MPLLAEEEAMGAQLVYLGRLVLLDPQVARQSQGHRPIAHLAPEGLQDITLTGIHSSPGSLQGRGSEM